MAQQIPPLQQIQFHGVYTAGNPTSRPRGTATVCKDFRIMPGLWLRTRGGRKYRIDPSPAGEILQLKDMPWNGIQMVQIKRTGTPSTAAWEWLNLPSYVWQALYTEPISLATDGSYALTNPVAITNLRDKVVMYNGYGVRGESDSKPPFSTNQLKYFGLDAYCPESNPSSAFAEGEGNNTVATSVDIWVGLYAASTDHYSNAVKAGTITDTAEATGTITVSDLANLTYATHGATETADLYYVFYATIDGGDIPYLILDSGLTGPYKVAVSATSASLSIASGTVNGWNLDLTSEAPYENHPPRPMKSICFVRDRIYGVPLNSGSGSAVSQYTPGSDVPLPDFKYKPLSRELAGVVWSRAAGDVTDRALLGDPLQCWPLTNIAYTPSNEQPVMVAPAVDGTRVLVLTPTSAFLLEEVADGLHEYTTLSRVHGIKYPTSLRVTAYGIVWVDQHNQIVCLPPNSLNIEILSGNYQSLMTGTPRCADYLVDPDNDIDRYEVFLSDSTSVCHDFTLPPLASPNADRPISVPGQGYKFTSRDYTAANTATDVYGKKHHLVAKASVWTQEAQAEDGLILTTDENTDLTLTQISGEYERNWDDFGDCNARKGLPFLTLVGDGEPSTALSNASPLTVEWYADFEQVTAGNKKTVTFTKSPQNSPSYGGKLATGFRFWYKLVLKLAGHSTDRAAFAKHSDTAQEGSLAANWYGAIVRFMAHLETGQNRV